LVFESKLKINKESVKMIRVYVNGFPEYYANYCKTCEEAINELKNAKSISIYHNGDYHTLTISEKDVVTAEQC
jgi:hypothetical protein